MENSFYRYLLAPLLEKLYGFAPAIQTYGNSIYAIIYSKELVRFKSKVIGMPIGCKDTLRHLPVQILDQGARSRANVVSGLYDADGCVKSRKTKSGIYPRISIAQKTRGIVSDLQGILSREFDITSTLYKNDYDDRRVDKIETRWFLDINGYGNLQKFASLIGSRHPVINERIRSFLARRN